MSDVLNKIDSFSTFVQLMVDGLKNEWVQLDMCTFGAVRHGICVGCAATNALCELNQRPFTHTEILDESTRANAVKIPYMIVDRLESAWDSLRNGDVGDCMYSLRRLQPQLPFTVPSIEEITDIIPECGLPMLIGNVDDRREIIPYQIFANELRKAGL